MPTTVTQKGQVTLPRAVRDATGIRPGTRVDVRVEEGRAIVVPVPDAAEREAKMEEMRRRIEALRRDYEPTGLTTEEIMEGVREPVPLA